MEEERVGWPLSDDANDDRLIHHYRRTARMPQNATDVDIVAISHQGLTNFYMTINLSNSSQTTDLRRRIYCVQSQEAQLGTAISMCDNTLMEADSWHGQIDRFFQMTAGLGAGGNGGGGGSFSKDTP